MGAVPQQTPTSLLAKKKEPLVFCSFPAPREGSL
jgi:hypothetical protein